ncbi:hypothetical protein KP509_07G017200 [Ceratopteris richardii]|uniref:Uncharacterized protein n=4 Tax=Ceratopteris richardii TaxID=49495 RepID=A0A8T2UCN8_CERRI|nr:hypothetical protein KP509_07G017200 [Ceratopteris richardii]
MGNCSACLPRVHPTASSYANNYASGRERCHDVKRVLSRIHDDLVEIFGFESESRNHGLTNGCLSRKRRLHIEESPIKMIDREKPILHVNSAPKPNMTTSESCEIYNDREVARLLPGQDNSMSIYKPPKIVKRVRFADQEALIIVSRDSNAEKVLMTERDHSQYGGSEEVGGQISEAANILTTDRDRSQLGRSKIDGTTYWNDNGARLQSTAGMEDRSSLSLSDGTGHEGTSLGGGDMKGVVRLKVMISRKELMELMSSQTTEYRRKEAALKLVERLALPVLARQSSTSFPAS